MPKYSGQKDQKTIAYDDAMDDDEIDDLKEDLHHLCNGLRDNINDGNNKQEYIEQDGVVNEQDEQGNHFGDGINNRQAQNEYFGAANGHNQNDSDDSDNNDNDNENLNQGGNNNNHAEVSDNDGLYNDLDIYGGDQEDNQ